VLEDAEFDPVLRFHIGMMLITGAGVGLNNVSHNLQNIQFVYNKKHYE